MILIETCPANTGRSKLDRFFKAKRFNTKRKPFFCFAKVFSVLVCDWRMSSAATAQSMPHCCSGGLSGVVRSRVPEQIPPSTIRNKRELYGILFRAGAETLRTSPLIPDIWVPRSAFLPYLFNKNSAKFFLSTCVAHSLSSCRRLPLQMRSEPLRTTWLTSPRRNELFGLFLGWKEPASSQTRRHHDRH
jgi:hypothetical protein